MKNIFLVCMLAVASTAYASKSRLIALGEDQYGSYFIEDQRNIFLNAGKIHTHKDFMTLEWGSTGNTPATATPGTDTDTAPNAEGGFITSAGPHVYGLYFGYEDNRVSQERELADNINGFSHANASVLDNAVTFFFGGNSTLPWGAAITYAKTQDQTTTTAQDGVEQQFLSLNFGALKDKTEINAHLNLINKAKDFEGDEFKGKIGVRFGVAQDMGNHKVFVQFRHAGFEVRDTAERPEGSFSELLVGAAREKVVNQQVSLFAKAQFIFNKQKLEKGTGANFEAEKDVKQMILPITAAIEAKILDWLVLRGSVSHNIWAEEKSSGKKKTLANSNDVNAGASMLFGNFTIDGLVGTGNDNTGAATTNTQGERGILSTDNIMTRVSMTYRF